MKSMRRIFAISLAVGLNGVAEAGEYRELTLSDGRVLQADVLETLPTGLRVETPHGQSLIAFELLTNMEPITGTEFSEQASWVVYLYAPEAKRELLSKIYAHIGQVDVYGSPATQGYLTSDQEMAMEGCAADLTCISKLSRDLGTPWMWVVSLARPEGGEWTVTAGVSGGSEKHKTVVSGSTPAEWYRVAHESVGLEAPKMTRTAEIHLFGAGKPEKPSRADKGGKGEPTDGVAKKGEKEPKAPKAPKAPKEPKVRTAEDLKRLGYVPLPGMPALAEQDMAGFGLAIGTAVPLTAVWAGAVGKHAQSGAEFATLTALGFYALTVSINKLTHRKDKSTKSGTAVSSAN